MHAISHSLAHRGPSASRARSRWQPYASSVTSSAARSPATYLNTPASSVSASPPPSVSAHSIPEPEFLKAAQRLQAGQLRDAQKTKYVTRLVDQAVKSLCDIWHPDDIPPAFQTPSRSMELSPVGDASIIQPTPLLHMRNIQLPSPISPSSHPSPMDSPIAPIGGPNRIGQVTAQSTNGARVASHLIPIKGFVHEVLRRSRTSTGVLQTALCYLEAIRGKIPEVLRKEKSDPGEHIAGDRIVQGFEEDFEFTPDKDASDMSYTIRIEDFGENSQHVRSLNRANAPISLDNTTMPQPTIPSPLLCPRRTFLACLILASKFMQDRSYSNRAWAKLAGLPPREIGRCERALGDILEWRLWVGKDMGVPSHPAIAGNGRTMTRSKSENNLLQPNTMTWSSRFLPSNEASTLPPAGLPTPVNAKNSSSRSLKRSATVPDVSSKPAMEVHNPAFGAQEAYPIYQDDAMNTDADSLSQTLSQSLFLQGPSPPLSTPPLFYSPMSSGSSSDGSAGDRTIQMSTFAELPMRSPVAYFAYPPSLGLDLANSVHKEPTVCTTGMFSVADAYGLARAGPKLAAINPAMATSGPFSLPSISETLGMTMDDERGRL